MENYNKYKKYNQKYLKLLQYGGKWNEQIKKNFMTL